MELLVFVFIFQSMTASYGNEEKENSQIGKNKGVLEANEQRGIKLSPEAENQFEISRVKISTLPFSITVKAIVQSTEEQNLFRFRDGFYKKITFTVLSKIKGNVMVQSNELKIGDEIAVTGLGFLRIAEIATFGGMPQGE